MPVPDVDKELSSNRCNLLILQAAKYGSHACVHEEQVWYDVQQFSHCLHPCEIFRHFISPVAEVCKPSSGLKEPFVILEPELPLAHPLGSSTMVLDGNSRSVKCSILAHKLKGTEKAVNIDIHHLKVPYSIICQVHCLCVGYNLYPHLRYNVRIIPEGL